MRKHFFTISWKFWSRCFRISRKSWRNASLVLHTSNLNSNAELTWRTYCTCCIWSSSYERWVLRLLYVLERRQTWYRSDTSRALEPETENNSCIRRRAKELQNKWSAFNPGSDEITRVLFVNSDLVCFVGLWWFGMCEAAWPQDQWNQ